MQKKLVIVPLLVLMMLLAASSSALADGEQVVNVAINGVLVEGQTAVIDKATGTTYVPLRFVAQELGAIVNWEQKTRTAICNLNGTIIEIKVNSKEMVVNRTAKELEAPAKLLNEIVVIPLRAVSEAFGVDVAWEPAKRTVQLVSTSAVEQTKKFVAEPAKVADEETPKPILDRIAEGTKEIEGVIRVEKQKKRTCIYVTMDKVEILGNNDWGDIVVADESDQDYSYYMAGISSYQDERTWQVFKEGVLKEFCNEFCPNDIEEAYKFIRSKDRNNSKYEERYFGNLCIGAEVVPYPAIHFISENKSKI